MLRGLLLAAVVASTLGSAAPPPDSGEASAGFAGVTAARCRCSCVSPGGTCSAEGTVCVCRPSLDGTCRCDASDVGVA